MIKFNSLTDNRQKYLENLYKLLKSEFTTDSDERINTIAIDSSWGTGKSHFAEALEEYIKDKNNKDFEIELIKFNAWENDYYEDPMQTLIGEINSQIKLGVEVKEAAEKIIKNSGKAILKIITTILSKKFGISDDDVLAIKDLFSGVNESSLDDYKKYKEMVENFKVCLEQKDIINGKIRNKVIIVDELDRCRPDFAIETLETIKHIFNVKGIIFIFMINKKMLSNSVTHLYGNINDDEEYFKKFFNLEFSLPKLEYINYLDKEYSNFSKDLVGNVEKFSVFLFLSTLHYLNLSFSPREQKHILRKFKILYKTFSEEEKYNVDFLYFITFYLAFLELGTKQNKKFSVWINLTFQILIEKEVYEFNSYKQKDYYDIEKNLIRLKQVVIYLLPNSIDRTDYSRFNIENPYNPTNPSLGCSLVYEVIKYASQNSQSVPKVSNIYLPELNVPSGQSLVSALENYLELKCSFIKDVK